MGDWEVLADAVRPQWTLTPMAEVGPLRFGMGRDEVEAAMVGFDASSTGTYYGTPVRHRTDFCLAGGPTYPPAVTTYYHADAGLFCVAADARYGPQVTFDGMRLTARVPSELESQFFAYLEAHDLSLQYTPDGNPQSDELGIIMRVQRAGDVVLSRPVFAIVPDWANTLWDTLPLDEYRIGQS